MGLVTRAYTYSAGAVIVASQHNDNENTLYNLVNGNLSTANIASNAGIVDTQLATISTTGKVNFSALTVTSQAQGDIAYASSSSVWTRLGAGTSGQFLKTQGTGANPIWADAFVAATQAEMEAASSTTVYASPGRAQFHPGVAKAWGRMNGTGTPAFTSRHNIDATITDNGAGDYTITWTTDFSAADGYAVAGIAKIGTGPTEVIFNVSDAADPAAGSFRFEILEGGGAATDTDIIMLVAFGDQA